MSELKRLKPKRINADDGFRFGLGFWLAWAAVSFVVLPVIACVTLFVLSLLGNI